MRLAQYALLLTAGSAVHAVEDSQLGRRQLKIPAIWSSPLFQSGGEAPSSTPLTCSPQPQSAPASLTESFQIHKPAPILTHSDSSCSVVLVQRSFANSYGSPSHLLFDPFDSFSGTPCADPASWTGLTLDIHGETRGRQFDRLGTVWVGNNVTGQGVEVMRLDNPEPTRNGVWWAIKKDVGKYYPLFSRPADIVFDLPNIVDDTYTGALNVTLSLTASVDGVVGAGRHRRRDAALPLAQRAADVVLPLSKRLRTVNSVFLVRGAENGTTAVGIPPNTARAVVEIYASGTANEEFWYTNIPDRFYSPTLASSGYFAHGTYREIQLHIDGGFAGFVTPYPVIFTGGINPLLWRPAANWGAFDQPTYNVDITPWLGTLTDGEVHELSLRVVSGERGGEVNEAWFVSGSVHVYLDASGRRTVGEVVRVEGGEEVDGWVDGTVAGDPTTNGSLTYQVGLGRARKFGVVGCIKTASGKEYLAGWYQQAQYDNKGYINATAQTNDQRSYGWTRSVVFDKNSLEANWSWDLQVLSDAGLESIQAVQLDYNYPLYTASYLSNTSFDAQVTQQFDRTVRRISSASSRDLARMVGDETTVVHADPVAALAHTTLSSRRGEAQSVLVNGAIANGSGTSDQSFMYIDMAGGTIDRVTRTSTTSVLEDRLSGSARGRAQPKQLTTA